MTAPRFARSAAEAVGFGALPPSGRTTFRASDWRPRESNSLRGFVTLELPSGLVLHDCSYHRRADGKEGLGLPGKPQVDRDGQHRKDAATGKLLYTAVVEIPDKAARARFQEAALAAVHALIGGGQ